MPPPHRDFKERSVALAIAHPWASASSCLYSLAALVTTAGDATPLWEDVTDPTCSGDKQAFSRLPLRISRRSLSPILAAALCHLAVVLLSPFSLLSLLPLSRCSPLPRVVAKKERKHRA